MLIEWWRGIALLGAAICGWVEPVRAERADVRALEVKAYAGVHTADYSTVGGRSDSFVAGKGSLGATLHDPLKLRFDGLLGRFGSGTWVGAGALRLYGQNERFSWGTGYEYIGLQDDIHSHIAMLHAEVYEGRVLSAVSSVGYELKNFGDKLGFAELLLRVYPLSWLTATAGASYAVSTLKQTRADIILRMDCRIMRVQKTQLGFFVQYGGNLFTRAQAGLVLYFDDLSFVARERADGLFLARFD